MKISIVANEVLFTAYINDVDGLSVSISGNSKNVMSATVVARALGLKVIGPTGAKGGELAQVYIVVIKVPESKRHMIQELHLTVYHSLCLMLEDRFFGGN